MLASGRDGRIACRDAKNDLTCGHDQSCRIRARSGTEPVRLWIDGQPIIDNWTAHSVTSNVGTVTLNAGYHPIKLEYFEMTTTAVIKLFWKRPKDWRAKIIPQNFFVSEERYLPK